MTTRDDRRSDLPIGDEPTVSTRDDCPAPRGECRQCGRVMTLKVNGTLRHHKPYLGGVPWEDYCCDGSGTLPVAASDDQERIDCPTPGVEGHLFCGVHSCCGRPRSLACPCGALSAPGVSREATP